MVVQSKEMPSRLTVVGTKVLVAVGIEEKNKEVNGEVEKYFEFEQLTFDSSFDAAVIEAMAVKYELSLAMKRAKDLLDTTEFKFNADYDQKDTPEWLELKAKRQEARVLIRSNS